MLTVSVPPNAKVTVNGHETSSDGDRRQFMSRGLKDGFVYSYVVEATYQADGREVSESQTVKLRAGEMHEIAFQPQQASSPDAAPQPEPQADANADAEAGSDANAEAEAEADVEASQDNSTQTSAPAADVITVVKLNVPADAAVTLAGNPTQGRGAVRTFRTAQLRSGQQWANYTIRVTADVNGQPVTKERTINVTAGSNNELTFAFDGSAVASR